MNKASATATTFGILAAQLAVAHAAGSKELLRANLRAGQSFHAVSTLQSDFAANVNGSMVQAHEDLLVGSYCEVRNVDKNGWATLRVWETGFNVVDTIDGRTTQYGSSSAIMPTVEGVLFRALLNRPIEQTMAPDGTVKYVTGYDAAFADIPSIPTSLSDSEIATIVRLAKSKSSDAASSRANRKQSGFPNYPVGIGDSWMMSDSAVTSALGNTVGARFKIVDRAEGTTRCSLDVNNAGATLWSATNLGAGNIAAKWVGRGTCEIDEATGMSSHESLNVNGTGTYTLHSDALGRSFTVPIALRLSLQYVVTDLPGTDEQVDMTPGEAPAAPHQKKPIPPDDGEVVVN